MKLQCNVEVVNRLHASLNVRSNGKALKSTLALGREPKNKTEFFILLFSSVYKTGSKYSVKCIDKVFVKCLNEGKATLRFKEPPHDLLIKSEVLQLKCFLKLLKSSIAGEIKDNELSNLSNISVVAKDNNPTKLVIRQRSEYPAKGLPRTLESLYMNSLKLCNFRRDILLLRHLVILDLANNEIEKIPHEFGRMPSLCELYLANNKLGCNSRVDWRWLLGPQINKTLKLLDLSGNSLVVLPKGMWRLEKLVTLKLDNNSLEKLPSLLGRSNSLRYLTISKNRLQYLPCGLLQCKLEFIDISSNCFHQHADSNTSPLHSPWDLYIGNLVNISSKVVLKHKIHYAPNIIPWTLVELLDNANLCVCGTPITNTSFSMNKDFEIKYLFKTVVMDSSQTLRHVVGFHCYFCSQTCYSKNNRDHC